MPSVINTHSLSNKINKMHNKARQIIENPLILLINKKNKKLSTEKKRYWRKIFKKSKSVAKNRLQFIDSIGDNKGAVSTSPAFKGIKTIRCFITIDKCGVSTSPAFKGIKTTTVRSRRRYN